MCNDHTKCILILSLPHRSLVFLRFFSIFILRCFVWRHMYTATESITRIPVRSIPRHSFVQLVFILLCMSNIHIWSSTLQQQTHSSRVDDVSFAVDRLNDGKPLARSLCMLPRKRNFQLWFSSRLFLWYVYILNIMWACIVYTHVLYVYLIRSTKYIYIFYQSRISFIGLLRLDLKMLLETARFPKFQLHRWEDDPTDFCVF